MATEINNVQPYYKGTQHMVGGDTFEPQRTNNFELRFEDLEKLESAFGRPYTNVGKQITLAVESVGDLQQSIDALAVSYGNNAITFAGKPTLSNLSISVRDFIGLNTERILEAWSRLVYDKYNQTVGMAKNYKKRAYLIQYTSDYSSCRMWQLEGCWPGTITYGGYNNDSNDIRKISFDLHVDFAYPLDDTTVDTAAGTSGLAFNA